MNFELTLPRGVRQVLAVALLLVPLVVLAALIFGYVSDVLQHRERVALLLREKSEYQSILQARPVLDGRLARLKRAIAADKLLYTGKTVDGDAKSLQARLAALLTTAGATGSQQRITVATASADGPIQIQDDVTFLSTMAQLRTLLYQLKLSQPLLIAQRMSIHASDGDGQLRVELQIAGLASPA